MTDAIPHPFWKRAPVLTGYACAIAFGGVAQVLLGSDPEIVAVAVAAALLSILPAAVFGVRDLPSLITLSVGARYASSAIAWRLVTGQRLDLGLYDSHTSFFVVLCGTSAIAAAAFIAHLLYMRKPLFREHYTPAGLEVIIAVGVVATLFGIITSRTGAQVLGGIGALAGTGATLLPIGLLCYNHARGKSVLSPGILMLLLALSVLGLGANSRQGVLQPFAAFVFFILCFRIPLSRKAIIVGVSAGALFVAVISPVMLVVRGARNFASPEQMIALTVSALNSGQLRASAAALEQIKEIQDGPYAMHYTTGGGELAMRMVNVEQMDILVDRAHRFGPIGTARFWASAKGLLPSAIEPDKSAISTPSFALWVYGLSTWGRESNATETAFGDAYAYGGIEFVLLSMFWTYLLLFALFRMFCPSFEDSPFALFFVAAYIHALTEQNVVGTLAVPIREFPFELALFWLASHVRHRFVALAQPQ